MATALKGTRLNNSIGNKPRPMVSSRGPTKDNKLPSIKPGSASKINEPEIQYKTPLNTAPTHAGGHHGGIKLAKLNDSFFRGFEKKASLHLEARRINEMEKKAFVGKMLGSAARVLPNMVRSGGGMLSSAGNATLSGIKSIGSGVYNTGKFIVHDAPVSLYRGTKNIGKNIYQGTKNYVAKERAAYDIAKNPSKAMPVVSSQAATAKGATNEELKSAFRSKKNLENTTLVGDGTKSAPTAADRKHSYRAQKALDNAQKGPVQFTPGPESQNGKFLSVSPMAAHDVKPTHRNSLRPRPDHSVGNSSQVASNAVGATPNTVGTSAVVEKATNPTRTPAQQNASIRKETQARPEKSMADKASQHFNIGFGKAKRQWNKLTPNQKMGVIGAGALGTGFALRGSGANQNNQQ